MGVCKSSEDRKNTIDCIRSTYPLYHEANPKECGYKHTVYSAEVYEDCLKFIEAKAKLLKANAALHKKLFDRKNQSKRLEVEHLHREDDECFYFFLNKRAFKELSIANSEVSFPKFSFQYFPRQNEEISPLTKLVITSSAIQFDEKLTYYMKLDNCLSVELSYCNIELLPAAFCKIRTIQKLSLRRNLLKTLPRSFIELKELIDVDLSENRFTCLPREIDLNEQKITRLNMNANLLESFEVVGSADKSKLEYLFLAQNNLTKIPYDIKKFFYLKFVNLDENSIMAKTHAIEEMELNVKISCFKNRGLNEMIELDKPERSKTTPEPRTEKMTYSALFKQQSLMRKELENIKTIKSLKTSSVLQTQESSRRDITYESLKIKSPQTQVEHEVAQFVNGLIEESKLTKDKAEFEDKKNHILEEQYCFMIDKVEHLINIGREKELGLIENYELKDQFKKCYSTYLKMKEYNNTGALPCRLSDMEHLEKQYFIRKMHNSKSCSINNQSECDKEPNQHKKRDDNRIKQREDVSNLIFLKNINQMIASSKVKMFLQYLGNIDLHIRDNLLRLWESKDNNAFILIITEMKLFIKEMIDFYDKKMKEGNIDVRFEVITSEEKNVIHSIFHNEFTLRILYRLGIQERKEVFKDFLQEQIIFYITNSCHVKHTQCENFLMRFIVVLKTAKADPMDFL